MTLTAEHMNATNLPTQNGPNDGFSKDGSATATCFCGSVQLEFPTKGEGLVESFICNCSDCHKLTAAMQAANFICLDTHYKYLRGKDHISTYTATKTIGAAGHSMTNYFCKTCGTLMYRTGSAFPGMSILRIGTVDDFSLMETVLKPQIEQFVQSRVSWIKGFEAEGMKQFQGESHVAPNTSKE